MNKIFSFFAASNRYKHLIGGIIAALMFYVLFPMVWN